MNGFNYDEEQNQMKCLKGHLMNTNKTSDPESNIFSLSMKICKICPVKEKCLSENN